jgi:hypothetical protein
MPFFSRSMLLVLPQTAASIRIVLDTFPPREHPLNPCTLLPLASTPSRVLRHLCTHIARPLCIGGAASCCLPYRPLRIHLQVVAAEGVVYLQQVCAIFSVIAYTPCAPTRSLFPSAPHIDIPEDHIALIAILRIIVHSVGLLCLCVRDPSRAHPHHLCLFHVYVVVTEVDASWPCT